MQPHSPGNTSGAASPAEARLRLPAACEEGARGTAGCSREGEIRQFSRPATASGPNWRAGRLKMPKGRRGSPQTRNGGRQEEEVEAMGSAACRLRGGPHLQGHASAHSLPTPRWRWPPRLQRRIRLPSQCPQRSIPVSAYPRPPWILPGGGQGTDPQPSRAPHRFQTTQDLLPPGSHPAADGARTLSSASRTPSSSETRPRSRCSCLATYA